MERCDVGKHLNGVGNMSDIEDVESLFQLIHRWARLPALRISPTSCVIVAFTVGPTRCSRTVINGTLQASVKAVWAAWSAEEVHHRMITNILAATVTFEAFLVPDTPRTFHKPPFALEYEDRSIARWAISLGPAILDKARTAKEASATPWGRFNIRSY